MSKTIRMARVSARGGFNLFWGLLASQAISAIGIILLARLLSPSEYGLVTVALIAPHLVALFRDWGVNSAVTKYVAQYRVENKLSKVKSIIGAGLLFEAASGLALSLALLPASGLIATEVLGRPESAPLIQIASFTIFASALITASQSVFIGYERMELSSITMICQSTLKAAISPILVASGLGALGAIVGQASSYLAAGVVSVILVYTLIYRELDDKNNCSKKESLRSMLRYGLPLSASAILSGLSSQFYNFLAAVYCTNAEIGNYSIATNFTVLITFFSTPISTVLFPAFSKLNLEEDCKALRDAFRLSVKYASLLVIPVAAAVMSLAQSAVATLFGEKYTYASTYLSLLSLSHIYTAFGSLSVGNLISSQGKTEVNMKLTLIAVATGLPLSLMLIPRLGVVGLILATLVAGAPSLIAALLYVKRHYGANVDLASSAKTLAVSATSALATSLLLVQLLLPSWAELVIGAVTFLTAYILMAPIIGAVETQDIQNIREIIKELGPISTLINQPLKIMGKIASATQGRGELPSSTDAETG